MERIIAISTCTYLPIDIIKIIDSFILLVAYRLESQDNKATILVTDVNINKMERSWKVLSTLLTPLYKASITLVNNRFIYLIGGHQAMEKSCLSTVTCFDIKTTIWTIKASMVLARANHLAFETQNKLYIVGGY